MSQLSDLVTEPFLAPNLSLLELLWLVVGLYANWRAIGAWHDAAGDYRVAMGPPPLRLMQREQASGALGVVRMLWLAVFSLELLGVAFALTPPPIVTTAQPVTPAAVLSAPLAVLGFVAITLALNTMVRSRARWRELYRMNKTDGAGQK